ncbi:HNH endonuclease [Halomarina pelagica]|uniref:HNH endonuclease n=1 Tax=Halomarina pelagica TaxID=2961599 RepID=UPI0020C2A7C5|nr:HNH endonuclease signature motif containing protein [Halomarina sp. BND7]
MGTYPCPTCSSEFDSRRGLGVHHARTHGERLPNRECARCGREFYCGYEKKYCSEDCRRESISFEATANPNYRAKKETTECVLCGCEFEYYPSEKDGLYCSECVKSESWRTLPDVRGRRNPRWKGGKVKTECVVCGETVERYPSGITSDAVVCGDECRRTWLSETFSGSGHPNWKGGGNESYGKGWSRIRRRALERDGYACVVCSKTKREIGRNPDVHHIVPVRALAESEEFDRTDAHCLENVVSLCVRCHRRADFGAISRAELRSLIRTGENE